MKTKSGKFLATISTIGLLVSLSAPATAADNSVNTPEIHAAIQNATTPSDHVYGRRAQDLQSHTVALIRDYERTVATDIQEAALHRQIASKLDANHARSESRSPAL